MGDEVEDQDDQREHGGGGGGEEDATDPEQAEGLDRLATEDDDGVDPAGRGPLDLGVVVQAGDALPPLGVMLGESGVGLEGVEGNLSAGRIVEQATLDAATTATERRAEVVQLERRIGDLKTLEQGYRSQLRAFMRTPKPTMPSEPVVGFETEAGAG